MAKHLGTEIKIESAVNWNKAVKFIPKKDQIIIYDGIKKDGTYIEPPRLKIGDGIHTVSDLPFKDDSVNTSYLEEERILIIN